jgi:short-subunit dehydrogenase
LATDGAHLALVARNAARLDDIASDLLARGARGIVKHVEDLSSVEDPYALFDSLAHALGGPLDSVMIFYGVLGEQQAAEHDVNELRRIVRVNFTSAAELAIAAAHKLDMGGSPSPALIAIGSVAGDRGRASNYVYGAAKGGLALVFQGLAHEYAKSRLRVVLLKAGFVDTPMTKSFRKGLLWAQPIQIAKRVKRSLTSGRPIIYVPGFWRWIMLVIRLLPQPIMNRLRI